jgi:purine-binding chemotaxis protein CheW
MAADEPESGLDWARAHARLARLAASAEAQDTLSPEAAEAVLEARARQLARPAGAALAPEALLEVVRFRAGGQAYGLASRFVHAVLRAPALTPLPGAPPLLRGLFLLRGEVLPVVEVAPLFGRPAGAEPRQVLVVGGARPELGVCAEEVEEVASLARAGLLPPPPALEDARGLVSGIDREGRVLLEGDALLGDSRLVFDLSDEGGP